MLTLEDVKKAHERIAPYVRKTPFLKFDYLSAELKKDIYLKMESLQSTGSFKIRGASNCVLANMTTAKKAGVIAASAGNHAQGVAAISNFLGVKATIVMPIHTPALKVQNTKRWGAEVVLHGEVYDEAYSHAVKISESKGQLFVHPFKDPLIMAGQGTCALEMAEEPAFKEIEAVVVSIGGGGLMAGCATVVKALRPEVKIYGVTAKNAPSAHNSFHSGRVAAEPVLFTLAEGVATKRPDDTMYPIMKKHLTNMFSVSEESIAHAISILAEQGKLIAEGAGVLPLAAAIEGLIPEKKLALIISGGNIDLTALGDVLQRGLAEQSRRIRLVITIPDRPGGLNSVTQILAESRANILQVFHQRANLNSKFGEADIEVELDTRGKDHTDEILGNLTKRGFRVNRAT